MATSKHASEINRLKEELEKAEQKQQEESVKGLTITIASDEGIVTRNATPEEIEEHLLLKKDEEEFIGDFENAEEALMDMLKKGHERAASLSYDYLNIDQDYIDAHLREISDYEPFLPEYLTCENMDERKEWDEYYLNDYDLGSQRMESTGEMPSEQIGETYQQYMYERFLDMIGNAIWKETYAIGYCRIQKNPKIENKGGEITGYSQHTISLIEKPPYLSQHEAIRNHARTNMQKLFYTFADYQMSLSGFDTSLPMLRMIISLCKIFKAKLLYCDLGNIYKFAEFNALIRSAEKDGVEVVRISDKDAISDAAATIRTDTSKKFGDVGVKQRTKKKNTEVRNPILEWKDYNNVSTKRFNYFEHLYKGTAPLYKNFISKNTRELLNPDKWEPIALSDQKLADTLNAQNFTTKEGYAWNRQSVMKIRTKFIFTGKEKDIDYDTVSNVEPNFLDYFRYCAGVILYK